MCRYGTETFGDFRTVIVSSKFDTYTSDQNCCYRHTVVKSAATEVLCHNVVLCHPVPLPVKSVVDSTATTILCCDVVQSGTITGRDCG